MNKGRGVPFSVIGVVTSTCRADLLIFTGETDVLEGAGLDEPMAKLLTVLPWLYVGGGKQIRGSEGRRSRNNSSAVEGGEVGAAAVRRRTMWLNWLGYGRLSLGFNY